MIKKIIIVVVLLMSSILTFVIFTFPPISKNFNRAVYTVVVHNQTEKTLSNISIVCGRDIKTPKTVEVVGEIDDLQPKEYRKINILTSNRPKKASAPYNVNVVLNDFNIYEVAGYFGIETGGLAVLLISENDGTISLKRIYEHEHLYKKINRRNNQNQNELSWY